MIDRESVFSQPEIIELLKNKFVAIALDQWYERRQEDNLGKFYQKIAKQGPRDFKQTTQGMYIADASGKLLGYINHHEPDRVKKFMEESLAKFVPSTTAIAPKNENADERFERKLPAGGLVVRVNTKILGGYEGVKETNEYWARYAKYFQNAIARDNLWVNAEEKKELIDLKFPESLAKRIARFNLIDNTRGEPPMWNNDEVRSVSISVDKEGIVTGEFKLATQDNKRGFEGTFYGHVEKEGEKLIRFDLVAKGLHWGQGRYTRGAPNGKFPIAMAFRLADGSDAADKVYPQGTKGWWWEYWK